MIIYNAGLNRPDDYKKVYLELVSQDRVPTMLQAFHPTDKTQVRVASLVATRNRNVRRKAGRGGR